MAEPGQALVHWRLVLASLFFDAVKIFGSVGVRKARGHGEVLFLLFSKAWRYAEGLSGAGWGAVAGVCSGLGAFIFMIS